MWMNNSQKEFTKFSQFFSTRCLTWLIIGAIVQLEQRKRDKRKEKFQRSQIRMLKQSTLRILRMCTKYIFYERHLSYDIASGRIAEMRRRICHALHDAHLVARMPMVFLNDLLKGVMTYDDA